MIQQSYNVLGVMSGTSLDGIDIAHIILDHDNGRWRYEIKEASTIPYSNDWTERLKRAVTLEQEGLVELDRDYTALLAGAINEFIAFNRITNPDTVCSHGHTILHQPHNGLTFQAGNLPGIATLTGHTVVCDFRVQDVALGGQGAPLVPVGDRLLFADYGACLNLGGFSNISFDEDGVRVAFDICPVNTVLNYYANTLGFDYDEGGALAASGTLNNELLDKLNGLQFYRQSYPKSLGFEYVKDVVLPLMEEFPISANDKLRTFTVHIATQVAAVVKKLGNNSLLITGGGAYNTLLIELLREMLPGTRLTVPDDKTIQFKEALIFALLGVLRLRNEVNVLGSVTGAKKDHCSGKIYHP